MPRPWRQNVWGLGILCVTANLRTKILDLRGFDSTGRRSKAPPVHRWVRREKHRRAWPRHRSRTPLFANMTNRSQTALTKRLRRQNRHESITDVANRSRTAHEHRAPFTNKAVVLLNTSQITPRKHRRAWQAMGACERASAGPADLGTCLPASLARWRLDALRSA